MSNPIGRLIQQVRISRRISQFKARDEKLERRLRHYAGKQSKPSSGPGPIQQQIINHRLDKYTRR